MDLVGDITEKEDNYVMDMYKPLKGAVRES